MRVIHILKDGSQIDDISGHVVRMEDAGALYNMIRNINRKSDEKEKPKRSGRDTGSHN